MTSDTSFWMKFLHDSDRSFDENTLSRYSTILADRFATIEEFLSVDENGLINLGINNPSDRDCLIKKARLLEEKEHLPVIRQSSIPNAILDNWISRNQSTPLNPKSKCHLSPALLSRISFNDYSQSDELPRLDKKCHFDDIIETPARPASSERIQKLTQSCQKRTPPPSAYGMRTLKSISDTISLQKKILVGTDRLKRLALTKSIFKRQTALITKKMSNLTNKFINPFAKVKTSNPRITIDDIKVTPGQIVIKNNSTKIENEENRTEQPSMTNSDRRSLHRDEPNVQPMQMLHHKRFKLGAPTTFVTRSLANHGHFE